jgi:microcystin-dependent protein
MPSTSTAFIGEIMLVPYNFAPRGWAFCQGQILAIAQNTALFSLLGTTYGGNGQTTFALPDLRGRCAISSGQGPGLSSYTLGEVTGVEAVTLQSTQLPPHSHTVNALDDDAGTSIPTNSVPANIAAKGYANKAPNTTMSPNMITGGGGNQPHNNIQPLLVLNYCIALQGLFPPRN